MEREGSFENVNSVRNAEIIMVLTIITSSLLCFTAFAIDSPTVSLWMGPMNDSKL